MNESRISVRYSRALFESALEKKLVDEVKKDMVLISEICKIPEVNELLESPVIVPSKKSMVLRKILGEDLQELTLSFVDLTVKNGRESSFPDIARVFIHETMKYYGIRETILTTAYKTDPDLRDKISGIITDLFKTKIDLKEVVDESIIGGFILKIEDNYFDASVRNKLRRIKKDLGLSEIARE